MSERVYVALDLETTGLNADRDQITEIGAVRFQGDRILDRFVTFVNPQRSIPLRIQQITGITDADVANAPTIDQVIPELLSFATLGVHALVAHNAGFDLGFLRSAGLQLHRPALDTFELASILLPGRASYSLGELCKFANIPLADAHRALDDATATAQLFMVLQERLAGLSYAVLSQIVTSGRDADWPPMLLFEDALQGAQPTVVVPLKAPPAPWPMNSESLLSDSGPPIAPVPVATITRAFAPDGPLAQQMGSRFERRQGQVQMAERVMTALDEGDHLLIEAGTGTGKSLAYLLPAALWSLTNQRRVVIATNTITLQEQLLDKDIPQVREVLDSRRGAERQDAALHTALSSSIGELRTAVLKGRGNYLCLRRMRTWLSNRQLSPLELRVLAKVLVWLPTTDSGDVSELFLPTDAERAVWNRICADSATCRPERCSTRSPLTNADWLTTNRDFYFEARQRADGAHLLIINHALLLADIAAGRQILPPYSHVVVDEAHHLEEVATAQQTYTVAWRAARELLARLRPGGEVTNELLPLCNEPLSETLLALKRLAGLSKQSDAALRAFAETLLNFVKNQDEIRRETGYAQRLHLSSGLRSQPDWSEIEIEWDNARRSVEAVVGNATELADTLEQMQWGQREPHATALHSLQAVRGQLHDLRLWLDAIILAEDGGQSNGIVTWLEVNDKGDDVSVMAAPLFVNDLLERALVVGCRSAIFTGATLRTGDGFGFIQERLGLWDVTTATVASPFDYARSTLLYLPNDLPQPNHPHYQQAVEQAIIAAATANDGRTMALFTSYAQVRTTASAIRAPLDRLGITVLQHGMSSRRRLLSEYRDTTKAVILGTRSFWEGIDLPGDELLALLIVKLPFAVPNDPLIAARSAELENPFEEYTLPDAILRFRQGFGRLIRRMDDRGVVVLLDSRIWQKRYGQAFLDALPACTMRHAPLMNLADEITAWMEK